MWLSRDVIMVISGSDRSHASDRGGEGEVPGVGGVLRGEEDRPGNESCGILLAFLVSENLVVSLERDVFFASLPFFFFLPLLFLFQRFYYTFRFSY